MLQHVIIYIVIYLICTKSSFTAPLKGYNPALLKVQIRKMLYPKFDEFEVFGVDLKLKISWIIKFDSVKF